MKRTVIAALTLALVVSFVGTGIVTRQVNAADPEATETVDKIISTDDLEPLGGWYAAENTKVTKSRKKIFNKAVKNIDGVDYKPVAYLGSQIVAGVNHCFLCKAKAVSPGARTHYAMVYVYENLKGKAEITNIVDLSLGGLAYPKDSAEL